MDLREFIKTIKNPASGYTTSKGHIIEIRIESLKKDPEYYYYDNGEKVDNSKPRPCIKCGKMSTKEGYDACLGELPGVKFACCGHGDEGYIEFNNGIKIRGKYKVILIKYVLQLFQ